MKPLRDLLRRPGSGPSAVIDRCDALRRETARYLEGRARRAPNPQPETRNDDAWREAQNNHARHMMDTMTEYLARFAPRARDLRDQLAANGISDAELDRLLDHPANPAGALRAVELLASVSRRLDPTVAALGRVYSEGPTANED